MFYKKNSIVQILNKEHFFSGDQEQLKKKLFK